MRIATTELPETGTVTRFTGNSAVGPVYGTSYTEPFLIELGIKRVVNSLGQEVVAAAFCLFGADSIVAINDQIDYGGRRFEAIDVQPVRVSGQTHHVEVYLKSAGETP